ncbi:MAG: peptidase M14 [Bacteroidetes bacterium QS_9_68_14]|nr:MAG: peptidase M14 [Bacteroidetes bacterium QS_9_68_14]
MPISRPSRFFAPVLAALRPGTSVLPQQCTCLLLATLLLVPAAGAQDVPLPDRLADEMTLEGVTGYDESIPRPEDVLGYQIGTHHTEPAHVVRYFEAVAEASPRVRLEGHGRTYEGRRLIHAFVTTEGQLGQLGQIRQRNNRLVRNPEGVSDGALADMPGVAYMGYSIHGDEASGTEAALLLLYHLAAGRGPAIERTLENLVTIIDPMFNPDGRSRFTTWVNQNRGEAPTADPQDREHEQPWPGGRTNHYAFDLNRDWLPAQHPATQGRLRVFHDWHPQLLTDFHEMGKNDSYFFQPGIPSRTNPNTPQENQDLTGRLAEYHAQALDDIGSLYYTRESYDDFYYGKGSTYPDINGSVGILFEQASSRSLKQETNRGVLHYAFTVRNQFAPSLSSLRGLVEMRTDFLSYQRDFYASADDFADEAPASAYVVGLEGQRTRAQAMAKVLQRHHVEIHRLDENVEANGQTFQAGSAYVVPTDQTQGRLVDAFMERTTTFPDSLFYDVSTWTLPLAFNTDYTEIEGGASGLLGEEITPVAYDGGNLVGGRSSYAYLMRWDRYFAPRALHRFQEAGIEPRLLTKPVTAQAGGQVREFPRGTVVIPVRTRSMESASDYPPADSTYAMARRAAQEDHVRIFGLESGLTRGGPDLGSGSAPVLERPKMALLVGEGTNAYNAGEVWHLMTERFDTPISLLNTEDVEDADLSRYNTMVMAGGYGYGDMPPEAVKQWVRGGGHLIALDDATGWAAEHDLADLEKKADVDTDSLFQDVPYAKLQNAYGAQQIGGSIFRAEIDDTHPLMYGYSGDTVPFFTSGTTFFEPPTGPGEQVATYTEEPRLSGYVSAEMRRKAAGSMAVATQDEGGGQVTVFADNPNFRAFWYGTNGMFLNAVFLGPAF